jgi:hypothetical protein
MVPGLSAIQNTLISEWDEVSLGWSIENLKTVSLATRRFWKMMLDVRDRERQESLVDDLVLQLFVMVFEQLNVRPRSVHHGPHLQLFMSGDIRRTTPDTCIVEDEERDIIIIILQEDKSSENTVDYPFAQAVAGSVAYFQKIQNIRKLNGEPLLSEFPIMLGPVFISSSLIK